MASNSKTKLQELATPDDRRAILRMLRDGKTIEQIVFPFEEKGGKEYILSILEAALLPEQFDNLPPFIMATKSFSDEGFKTELGFLNLEIEESEFSNPEDYEKLLNVGIVKYWQLLSAQELPIPDQVCHQLFHYPIALPVNFSDEQLNQLEK